MDESSEYMIILCRFVSGVITVDLKEKIFFSALDMLAIVKNRNQIA